MTPVICNLASAAFALTAAILWYWSATVKVAPTNEPDASGWIPATIEADGSDFIKTAIAQARWSKRAAKIAALAALFQGIALLVQMFQPSCC